MPLLTNLRPGDVVLQPLSGNRFREVVVTAQPKTIRIQWHGYSVPVTLLQGRETAGQVRRVAAVAQAGTSWAARPVPS